MEPSGRLVFCNLRMCESLGYSCDELLGKTLDLLLPVASKMFYQTHISPILQLQGAVSEIFLSLKHRNTSPVPILWNVSSILINDEKLYLFTGLLQVNRNKFEDELIRARKQALDALESDPARLAARLDANRYLEEIEAQWRINSQQSFDLAQFNRVLGHDIREPVRKILFYTEMLKNFSEDKAMYTKETLLEKVVNSAQVLGRLADNLQNIVVFETEGFTPEKVSVNNAIDLAIQRVRKEFADVNISLVIEGELAVWADKEQLQTLFYLLMLNSIENRTDVGVSVIVTLDTVRQNEFRSGKGGYRLGETGRIRFSENGNSEEQSVNQLLDLFKSLKAGSTESLNLSMVLKIVEQNNGNLTVETVSGKKSNFTIFLPLRISKALIENNEDNVYR